MSGDRHGPMIDRDELYLEGHLTRGFHQSAAGSSCTAEKVCTIEFQAKPPNFTIGDFQGGNRRYLRTKGVN
jgi:hypothetical protein